MVAPHGDDERILEKRSGGETLPRILKGPDRESNSPRSSRAGVSRYLA
jgi:hypothetical protein